MNNKRYWVEESCLTNMADVIRNKTGITEKLTFPDEFLENIINIGATPNTTLPVLNSNYPEDVTVVEAANISAAFAVNISIPGIPAEYTYQWFMDGVAIEGANNSSWQFNGNKTEGVYNVYCEVTNDAGVVTSRISSLVVESYLPEFDYSGTYNLIEEENYNWKIKFLTSGTFIPSNNAEVDVFLVGAGGGGYGYKNGGTGGAGGKTTLGKTSIVKGQPYEIIIGAGGSGGSRATSINGSAGGETSAFQLTAAGGGGASEGKAGSGGSGGGVRNGNGGSDGSNGYDQSGAATGGTGQGTTTREFHEEGATLYAGGGAGSRYTSGSTTYGGEGGGGNGGSTGTAGSGEVNTGGGGGGSGTNSGDNNHGTGGAGGSGIVIIRNHRS